MANDENLIPQNRRTKSEQREIARLGGMVSGEMRRQRKSMREAMQIGMFELELPENEKDKLKSAGVKNQGMMTVAHLSGLFKDDEKARREFYKLIDMQ